MSQNRKFHVRVPASTSNLGPGLDVMGLALGIYSEVTFEVIPHGIEVDVEGEGAEILRKTNGSLVLEAAQRLWKKCGIVPSGVRISIQNHIPLYSGLGSSGAAIVAGLLGANAFMDVNLCRNELLNLATEMEGHPDNVAASLLGGFVLCSRKGNQVDALSFRCPTDLAIVILYPRIQVGTHESRKQLPREVLLEDAIANIGRTAQLAAAFATGRLEEAGFAFTDQLHQARRARLLPHLPDALDAALQTNALGAFLSGSGPSVAALCRPEQTNALVDAFEHVLRNHRLEGQIYTPEIDYQGAVLTLCP